MLSVQRFTFNSLAEHTYVVYDETKACAIIDPGCFEQQEKQMLSDFIQAHALQVTHLINTHCHIDHVLGNHYVKNSYSVKLAIHPQEVPMLQLATTYAPQCGINGIIGYEPTEAEILLTEGDTIQVGNTQLAVLHVPGHSPGHIVLYSRQDQLCLVGDVLFQGSIGRTDLPGSDHDTLIQSIHQKLFPLGDQVTIYPGHGPATTIGVEKSNNPFCKL